MTTVDLALDSYHQALIMLDNGVKQNEILDYLTIAGEKIAPAGSVSSILFLDKEGKLRNAASPNLPDDYIAAIDGLKPDPCVGTCAAAAATGEIVLTPSFYADNKWSELRHLPMALGFIGAWSMPIKSPQGIVLGTFGTYFREERIPSSEEMKSVALLATAAAKVMNNTPGS